MTLLLNSSEKELVMHGGDWGEGDEWITIKMVAQGDHIHVNQYTDCL